MTKLDKRIINNSLKYTPVCLDCAGHSTETKTVCTITILAEPMANGSMAEAIAKLHREQTGHDVMLSYYV